MKFRATLALLLTAWLAQGCNEPAAASGLKPRALEMAVSDTTPVSPPSPSLPPQPPAPATPSPGAPHPPAAPNPGNPNEIVPMLKCPAVPEAYSKMMTSLKILQTQIKLDAKGNCDPVKQEVISLQSLLDTRRKAVVDLIAKSKTTPLTEAEMTVIREYVNDVTTKVINTAELLDRSNQCFDEDRQKLGFGDLATLTLDATALAKTVAGPWAAPVALGGEALAGIFEGLGRVVKNRRGFDFTNIDQRQSFVQSLCSYYNYRQDMNALMFPARRATELRKVEQAIRRNLMDMTRACPQCKAIADSIGRDKPEDVTRKAQDADRAYLRPLGTYTVQSLSAMDWVQQEEKQISEQTGDEFGIGRDLLSEKAAEMDQFFYTKEAPDFLRTQSEKANDLFTQFSRYVFSEGGNILASAPRGVDVSSGTRSGISESEILEYVTQLRNRVDGKSSLQYRIDDYERASLELLDRTSLALQVEESYCRFFEKAGYYNDAIQNVCEAGNAVKVRAKLEALAAGKPTTDTDYDPSLDVLSVGPITISLRQAAPPKPTVDEVGLDWPESLQMFVDRIANDPARFSPAK